MNKVLKNGHVPGFRTLQNGIGSYRYRFCTFSCLEKIHKIIAVTNVTERCYGCESKEIWKGEGISDLNFKVQDYTYKAETSRNHLNPIKSTSLMQKFRNLNLINPNLNSLSSFNLSHISNTFTSVVLLFVQFWWREWW